MAAPVFVIGCERAGTTALALLLASHYGIVIGMERYRGIDFWKTRHSATVSMATSRRLTVTATMNGGDQIRFVTDPFLGSTTAWDVAIALRPIPRFQSDFSIAASNFRDARASRQEFDVKILRSLSTYQFTERLLIRNITEHNTLDKTVGENLLLTYRVNAGTVFYLGFDTRYRHADQVNTNVFRTDAYTRTNRAIFTKLQYLFRYQS